MKKILALLGLMLVLSVLGAMLDTVLGISYPSFTIGVIHKFFYMAYGAAIILVAIARI